MRVRTNLVGSRERNKKMESLAGYLFLSPWLIGLVVFTIIPVFTSLYLSFTDYNMLTPPVWTGMENYKKLFADTRFIKSLSVTAKFVLLGVPIKLVCALLVAVLLNKKVKGLGIYRAVYYLPSLLGSSVAVSILWRQIFNRTGLVNQILAVFGIQGMNWIATPSTAIYTIILLEIWQFGSPMLIFLAGLRQIPAELYESASIDGASKARCFFSITLPLLSPTIFFNLVMQMINALQSFNSVYIISGGKGGPLDSTLLLSLYLYLNGFSFFKMGYASAIAWVILIIVAIITIIQFKFSGKWVFYENE
jgi:multiple sugar transport system permease protein